MEKIVEGINNMRVFQINTVCGVGSTGRIATDLYTVLIDNHYECCIAYGRGKKYPNIDFYKFNNLFDVCCHALKSRFTDKSGLYSIVATQKLVKKIKSYKPDIIHLHNIHGYYVNYKILFEFLRQYNKPVIWTLHDCWAFTGHCTHFDYIGCNKWQYDCIDCEQKNAYPASLLLDNSTNNYHIKKKVFTSIKNMTIVTPSKWLSGLVKKSFLSKYQIKTINNGIDLNVFKPVKDINLYKERYKIKDKFVILGTANKWTEKKGLEYFKKLAGDIDNASIIILVGLNKKQLKYLPDKIIGIEKTDNTAELAKLYSLADVFINPTLEDSFSMTNLEALACGTPVITFNTGGSVECVNKNCGYIVKKGDVEALVRIIKKMKNKEIFFSNCRENAKKYDKNNRFYDYLLLYKKASGAYYGAD